MKKKTRRNIFNRLFIPEISVVALIISAFATSISAGIAACACLVWGFFFNSAWLLMFGFCSVLIYQKIALTVFAAFFLSDYIIGFIIRYRFNPYVGGDSDRILFIYDGAIPLILTRKPQGSIYLSKLMLDKGSLWNLSQKLADQISPHLAKYEINGVRIFTGARTPGIDLRLDVSDVSGRQHFLRSWTMNYYILKSNI